ncbi:ribonuclease E/G [Paracoccus salsus]|uniref:ribonuclease E/G n=1 Tax=Paracoccus salsus TaxID=2911061 RepID=UPI001F43A106|nr:ribonuclease E/G [Paracoccus salsus]MCF3973885.1 Rne/Rng family ribonuclease [Paracoccus salsus]
MAKKMLIDATHAEETRVVVADGTKVEEFDFETINKRQISGNIYLAKITRVEPSLQAAFVDYGGNRHGFLAFAEIHPDYYQIPAADREALIAEERAQAEAQEAEESARGKRGRGRSASRAEKAEAGDETLAEETGANADDAAANGDNDADSDDHGDAAAKDDSIESVADDDVSEEIRSTKKSRPRRYKIQEVVKVRQIMLVQVVKEERGNKGAALTTYLSLAGRYCVLMPNTARGGGISRKITNAADRKKLKDIAGELDVPKGAGLIIRTAGSQRTRTEIRRDYEYLLRLWEQIRDLTFKSVAPAPIYEEGDLIKRTIRDLYSKEIDEVLVEGERGYRVAKDFMKMIMPSHAKNVKHYNDQMPLFARFQVESYLSAMFNPVVQLKSGGYIVIGVTEALVAIDVNSGRATKEGSIEETALKTNLEAADEVARQLRLRDLAGLIVIDFIDMEERRNNASVEKRMKDRLKSDRARIQIGRISGFGLMEMSRQRLRPGMLESTTQPCPHCHGTGLIRSDDSLALTILRAIEEEGTRKRSLEVLVRAPVAVANFLINVKREHIAGIELRYGMSVRIEGDPTLISPDFALEKFKTATRVVPSSAQPVLSVNADLMAQIDDEDYPDEDEDEVEAEVEVETAVEREPAEASPVEDAREAAAEDDGGRGRNRRRRRRRRKTGDRADEVGGDNGDPQESDEIPEAEAASAQDAGAEQDDVEGRKPRTRSRNRRRGGRASVGQDTGDIALPEVVDLRDHRDEDRADSLPGVNAAYDKSTAVQEARSDDGQAEALADAQNEPAAADVSATERSETTAEAIGQAEPAVFQAEAAPEPRPSAPHVDEHVATTEESHQPTIALVDHPADAGTPPDDADDGRESAMAEADAEAESDRPKRRGWWSAGS